MKPNYPFIALVLGFGLWTALGYLGKAPMDSLVDLLKMGLGGLVVHMLKGLDAPAPAAPAQGGFASIRLLAIVAAITLGLSLVAGCTTTTASVYKGLETQAVAGVKVFDDNALETMKTLLCAQPYSAIQRNAQYQPGIQALCGPLANTASLDPSQIAQMLNLVKQLGLVPSVAPVSTPAAKP